MANISKIEGYELLSKKVYRIIKSGIIDGSLKSGSKLLEVKIAKQMGISRTPIREALRELAAKGFVTMIPNQGIIVSGDSIEDIREVMQIRGALEGLAARLAATMISKEEISRLENLIRQMDKFTKKNDALSFGEVDAKLHNIIINSCGNNRLIQMRKNITEQAHRYRIKSLNVSGRLKYSTDEHQKIVEALRKKDSEKADKFSRKHIENTLKNILDNVIIKREDKNINA
jgi:DNA-binding GntR family transcriptional regulator